MQRGDWSLFHGAMVAPSGRLTSGQLSPVGSKVDGICANARDGWYYRMSLLAMSLGDWFCVSRKGGTGEVGWYTKRVKIAWPCLGWL